MKLLAVFVISFVVLSWNLWNVGIASGYIDPLLHFGAQDEATYTREAITMAREVGWMTPTFLGRWVFEKPPLLMWLAALSMKTFGIGRVAARLPVVLAGALICALCFFMVQRERSLIAGVAAAAMAVSSQILFTLARHSMTDILLAAAGMVAFAILLLDPDLRKWWSFAGFVVAAAAGITAKSVAGVLVLAVMGVVVGLGRGSFGRERWGRAICAGIAAIVLASPWFLYNFFEHREWFLADMRYQILVVGTAGHQTANENHLLFYLVRTIYSDLLPLVLALTAFPALFRALGRRESAAVLAAAYGAIYFAGIIMFRYNSEQYLCPFIPSLILIGALYSPLLNGRGAAVATAVVCLVFGVKIANPDLGFGVSMESGSTIAAAPVLSHYCEERRATDLFVLAVDDEFYSSALPLHGVHYGWIDADDTVAREHPHLPYLGILIPAAELAQLPDKMALFRDRLRAWGLDSTQAVATAITAHSVAELVEIIHQHPEADFLVARSILPEPEKEASHRVVWSGEEFTLLESKVPVAKESAAWSCEM